MAPWRGRRDQKGNRVSEDKQSGARHDTLRLIRDLADALATQAARYKRLASDSGAGKPQVKQIDTLVDQARDVKEQAHKLGHAPTDAGTEASGARASTAGSASGRVVPFKPDGSARGRARGSPSPAGVTGAAHTLAIEMKIEGRSRDEVEQMLVETFGLSNVSAIVDEVFSGSGSN
jgi:hypothetical protein